MPSPRAGLIAGGVCTVISAITVFSTELGVVAGLGLFGGLTLCALGGLALHAALRGPRRIANDPTWTNAVRVIEREDKHAALGHTAGGLSSADAVDGGLSSADPVDQT